MSAFTGKNRRNLTITIVASIIAVVAIVAGAFAIGRNSDTSVQPSIEIGSRIDKSLGSRRITNASVWDGNTTGTIWTNGTGTAADPYLIESAANLAYLSNKVNAGTGYSGKYFKQTVDIDLNNVTWKGIGDQYDLFNGNYDGNNLHIINYITSGGNYKGLFGNISGGSVKNINLKHSSKVETVNVYRGGIAGATKNTSIINCHVEDFNATVNSSLDTFFGVIVGYAESTTITNCSAKNITISNVSTDYAPIIGGIVGQVYKSSTITGCIVENASISSNTTLPATAVGGIVGRIYAVSGSGATISNCRVNNAYISGIGDMGGALGTADVTCVLDDVIVTNTRIDFELVNSAIYGVGGIIGSLDFADNTKMNNCYSEADITTKGECYVGGLIGNVDALGDTIALNYCCFYGSITSLSGNPITTTETGDIEELCVGGIIGYFKANVTCKNILFQGKIVSDGTSSQYISFTHGYGNVGFVDDYIKYTNVLAIGSFEYTNTNKGKYFGYVSISSDLTSTNCYGLSGSATGGELKTIEELETRSTYDAWTDFDTYWVMDEYINYGLPVLSFCKDYVLVTDFEGEGTATSPYIINSVQGLKSFAGVYEDEMIGVDTYWKIADGVTELDLSSLGSWIPVGYNKDNAFTGHFNGNKCKITGLNIDNNYTYVGLFGYVASGANIEWLSVNGTVAYDSAKYVGGLAGYVDKGAIVSDCYFEGNITGYMNSNIEQKVGSLVGYSVNNDVETSYAAATHTRYYAHKTSQGKLAQVYVLGANPEVVGNVTTETLEDLGFDLDQWVGLADIPTANFSITRNAPNYGTIYAEANVGGVVETVTFTDNISDNQYKKGTEILVEATAASGYAIKSLTIDGMEYSNAINKPSILISYNTANTGKVLHIEAQFDKQYTLTLNNGTNYNLGTETVTGSYIPASAPYTVLTGTHVTVTATAKEKANNDTYKAFITSIVIDGETILLDSIDNETVKSVNGKSYTIRLVKTTDGFKTEKVTSVTISYVQTSNNTITINYGAEQEVITSLTIVDGVGGISSPEKYEDSFVTEWGSTIPTQEKTKDTEITENYTFIGWAVDGQIVSGEETFTTEVGSNTTVTQLWAKLYNVTITLPEGETSVRLSHKLTGLMYNLTEGTQELMAGEWIVSVPTGRTLKVNGVVQTRVNGIYTVRFTADTTIEIV